MSDYAINMKIAATFSINYRMFLYPAAMIIFFLFSLRLMTTMLSRGLLALISLAIISLVDFFSSGYGKGMYDQITSYIFK